MQSLFISKRTIIFKEFKFLQEIQHTACNIFSFVYAYIVYSYHYHLSERISSSSLRNKKAHNMQSCISIILFMRGLVKVLLYKKTSIQYSKFVNLHILATTHFYEENCYICSYKKISTRHAKSVHLHTNTIHFKMEGGSLPILLFPFLHKIFEVLCILQKRFVKFSRL